jgi:hypothetical protein
MAAPNQFTVPGNEYGGGKFCLSPRSKKIH